MMHNIIENHIVKVPESRRLLYFGHVTRKKITYSLTYCYMDTYMAVGLKAAQRRSG